MVATMEDLAERAFAQCVDDLVSISQMIMINDEIIATVIIITVIIGAVIKSGHFFLTLRSDVVDGGEVQHLLFLKLAEVLALCGFQEIYQLVN